MAEINPTAINPFNRYAQTQPAATASTPEADSNFWGEDGFSFGDILDLINPLQHIPIIGTIYRAVTGDDISIGSRIIGAGLFGGVIGVGAAVVSAIIEEISGEDIDEHIMAMFDGDDTPTPDGAPARAVLASAAFGRRDQEAPSSDRTPREPATPTTTVAVLASAAFGRRDQEAPSSDWTPREPTTTVAALASAERDYAFYPAYGRGAQEASMTSPRFLHEPPADHAPEPPETIPPVLAALPDEPAAVQTLATVEGPLSLIPREAAWLAALPRAKGDFTATAIRYVTPETGLQIAQALAGNGDLKPMGELNAFTRFAIDRYSQQALAAKIMRAEPGVVDIIY